MSTQRAIDCEILSLFKTFAQDTIDIEPVNSQQVYDQLKKLNANKATGHDKIPPKVSKIGAAELAIPLATLFNACIEKETWPSQFNRREGKWIPTFKRDDLQVIGNYRPVAVLSCVAKVFEQLLGKQITDKFESKLADCQLAYRKYHSCETTLISLVEDWKQSKDNGLSVGI